MNKLPERIRIKDIARLADVSVGTVDRVIHGRSGVSEALALKLTECGVHILRNNMEQIKIGEDHINIYGT